MKSYYRGPIGTRQRSFERYHPRQPTASPSPRLGVRNPNPKLQSLLCQERVKLRTANLVRTFTGPSEQKPINNLGKKERGHIQGLPTIFECPLLSQEWVKLRTSNFVCTFTGSLGTKGH